MKLNLTMLLRIMLEESFDITLARVLMLMLRCKSCLKTIETNKAESKDATEDKVEDSNDDTCNVCTYDFLTSYRTY